MIRQSVAGGRLAVAVAAGVALTVGSAVSPDRAEAFRGGGGGFRAGGFDRGGYSGSARYGGGGVRAGGAERGGDAGFGRGGFGSVRNGGDHANRPGQFEHARAQPGADRTQQHHSTATSQRSAQAGQQQQNRFNEANHLQQTHNNQTNQLQQNRF